MVVTEYGILDSSERIAYSLIAYAIQTHWLCSRSRAHSFGLLPRLQIPGMLCVSVFLAAGRSYLHFSSDSVDSRVLNTTITTAVTPMTVPNCVDACVAAGFTVAGVEYSSVSNFFFTLYFG